ncbi:alpha 1,4-glycosyltransferase [Dyadobacter jiangsuensis]|uniref:Alpha 1,4-glycosyltransferase n=2 Tax=Dyadobacter jiangsuensis TaxID=1591085 RepID=A0A2P8FIH9_9BACT|nr:alpha 1,4-glycosyltransferase [Dyadobacter jiangsuensis]
MVKQLVVQSLWIEPLIGDLQLLCLTSFIQKGVKVHLYTYTNILNLPDGVDVFDANEIVDRSCIFRDVVNSYATFSDWFRIKLLHEKGGWWVDCDVFCVRPFDVDVPYVFATEVFDYYGEKNLRICNAVIKMPKGSRLGELVLLDILERLERDVPEEIPWTEIGAKILDSHIASLGLTAYIVSSEVFCPIDYENYKELSEKDGMVFTEWTYGVHLWNKMWEWNNHVQPLKHSKENSFLGKMMDVNNRS